MFYKIFIISTLLLYVSCGYNNPDPFLPLPIENDAAIKALEERRKRLQEQARELELKEASQNLQREMDKIEAMRNTPCLDPQLYNEPINEESTSLAVEAALMSLEKIQCAFTICRCAYFNGVPSQWKVKASFNILKQRKSEEELKAIFLQTCKSHNKSFKIHSCSETSP